MRAKMSWPRRVQARREVDVVDRDLPDQRPEHDHEHHHGEDDQADDGEPVPAKAAPRLGRRRDVAQASRRGRGGDRRIGDEHAHSGRVGGGVLSDR